MTKSPSNEEIINKLELAQIDSSSNTEISNGLSLGSIEPPITYASLSTRDKILFNVAFITGGISGFIVWNCIVNSGVSRQYYLWPGQTFTAQMGAAESATAILTTVIMYWCNGLDIKLIYAGGCMSLLVTILFPTISVVYAGMENLKTGKTLLILVSLIDGVANGLFSVVSLSFASIIPFSHVIPLGSCGIGVAGITAFSSYLVLSTQVFPQTLEGQKPLLFTFFLIATFLIIVHLISFTMIYHRPWFNKLLKKALLNSEETWSFKKFFSTRTAKLDREVTEDSPQDSKEVLDDDDAPMYRAASTDKDNTLPPYKLCSTDLSAKDQIPSSDNIDINDDKMDTLSPPARHIKLILKDCWRHILVGALTTAITAATFPNPGPETWGNGDTWQTIFIGTFQVFNVVMRFTPAWAPLRIPFKWFWPVVFMRLGFIPLFLTPGRWGKGNVFWSHPATLITMLFVYTAIHGWAVTLATMYATQAVDNPKEKAIVSKVLVIFYAVALTLGFSLTTLYSL